ncbi:MAG: hypothetical protein JWO11_823 [Nocardioides sp.]|nr:hypothetical protein [Nocardioides sp.]
MRIRYAAADGDVQDVYDRPDELATEPMPERADESTYVLDRAELVQEQGGQLIMRGEARPRRVEPQAVDGGRSSIDELREYGGKVSEAYRPRWLDVNYQPRIRPVLAPSVASLASHRTTIAESITTGWPWTTVGKLWMNRPGQSWVGSAVLVGPRLLLTASHAVPWGTSDAAIRFAPAYRNGNDPRFGDAYVLSWRGVQNTSDVTGLDYVICELDWRIGDRAGWLGSWWSNNEDFYYNPNWSSTGYPVSFLSGERPALESPLRVVDIDDDGDGLEIETYKFALGGWSGGPLWGWVQDQPRVVGIESGFETDFLDPTRTVFAGGQHLVNLVNYGWSTWP